MTSGEAMRASMLHAAKGGDMGRTCVQARAWVPIQYAPSFSYPGWVWYSRVAWAKAHAGVRT